MIRFILLLFVFLFGTTAYLQGQSLSDQLVKAEEYLYEEDYDQASNILLSISKQCKSSENDSIRAVYYHHLGSLLIKQGEYDDGIKALSLCCVIREKEEDLWLNEYWDAVVGIIDAYVDLENYQKAAYVCRRTLVRNEEILNLNPGSLDILGMMGRLFMPEQIPWIYSQLGTCMEALGDSDIVDRMYLKGQEYADVLCSPEDPWGLINLYNLRRVYTEQQKYEQANEQYNKIIQKMEEAYGNKHPEYLSAVADAASFYTSLGVYDAAVGMSEYALSCANDSIGITDPVMSRLYPQYLLALSALGRYDDIESAMPYALTTIENCITCDWTPSEMYYCVAVGAKRSGNNENAQKYYRLYQELNEDKENLLPLE